MLTKPPLKLHKDKNKSVRGFAFKGTVIVLVEAKAKFKRQNLISGLFILTNHMHIFGYLQKTPVKFGIGHNNKVGEVELTSHAVSWFSQQ